MTLVQRAFADPTGAGDNQIVAAQGAGKKIRVLAARVSNNAGTANNVRWRSATNSKSGLRALAGNAETVWPYNQEGWLETNANEALNLNLSAATAVGVEVVFKVVG